MNTSQPYILNRVQNPKALEITYKCIEQGNQTDEDLAEATGFDEEKLLNQATSGLNLYGLIEKRDYEYHPTPLAFDTGDETLNFKMTMLHNIATEADEDQWGKQSAVLLNFEYLIKEDRQYFSGSNNELISDIDRWHQEKEYEPRNNRGERSSLNQVKFSNWTNQAEYLGLIHNARGNEYTVHPAPDLVVAAIESAMGEFGSEDGIETREFVSWLQDNLLRIPLTSEGHFSKAFSRVLYALADRERISFFKSGDARGVPLTGVPVSKVDAIAKDANHVKVIQ
jgi:hypothetical protein